MRKFLTPILLFFGALTLVLVLSSRAMHDQPTTQPKIAQVPTEVWDKLSQKRILFGHASVGYNIVEGIQTLQQEYPAVKLNVVHSVTPWTVEKPAFTHFHWEDLDLWRDEPATEQPAIRKVNEFSTLLTTKMKGQVDIALMKFCWADFKPDTDVSQVFSVYQEVMAKLTQEFPDTLFVHVTTPIVSEPQGLLAFKNRIKQLIGKPPFYLSDNIKINQLNDRLRAEYAEKEAFFDLAQIESTTVDGKRQISSQDGKDSFALVPDYTDDMGHLNEVGRHVVADHLLIFLADLVS